MRGFDGAEAREVAYEELGQEGCETSFQEHGEDRGAEEGREERCVQVS